MKIKAFFPEPYYLARKIKIKLNGQIIGKIGHNESIELEVEPDYELRFHLDYHRQKMKIRDANSHLILFFEKKDGWYLMFRNALRIKEVKAEDFERASAELYTKQAQSMKFSAAHYGSITLGLLLSLFFTYYSLVHTGIEERNFIFLVGIIGFLSFILLLFKNGKIEYKNFLIRNMAFLLSVLLLVGFVPFAVNIKIGIIATVFIISALLFQKLHKHEYH